MLRLDSEVRTVGIVDGHAVVRWAMPLLLANCADLKFSGSAPTPNDGLNLLQVVSLHLVVVGLNFSEGSGFSFIKDVHLRWPTTRILVYTPMDTEVYVSRCVAIGVQGFVSAFEKPDRIVWAIREILQGHQCYPNGSGSEESQVPAISTRSSLRPQVEMLSVSEFEILDLIGRGLSNGEIATMLSRSKKTIDAHRARMKTKLKLASSAALAQFAFHCRNLPSPKSGASDPGSLQRQREHDSNI